MVKIKTRDFGEIEADEDDIYSFPNGVFAFEDVRHFALISPLGKDVYPMWLQSTEDVLPCFIVFDPKLIDENYRVVLSPAEERVLRLDSRSKESLKALVIARVPEDFKKTTANMKSPIIINDELKIASQVILPLDYNFRRPVYSDEE